ncbi:hypothetical protein [Breoghania sp.]|uniref:hypothetical protein n=1 Tax=Breoghania sp. TaxID=2065378 RepID=UPI0029C9C1D1|nr:hypothetical protein [Breoghania sp.]
MKIAEGFALAPVPCRGERLLAKPCEAAEQCARLAWARAGMLQAGAIDASAANLRVSGLGQIFKNRRKPKDLTGVYGGFPHLIGADMKFFPNRPLTLKGDIAIKRATGFTAPPVPANVCLNRR